MAGKFIIAIDLGGTNLKLALINPDYKIIGREVLPTKAFGDRSSLILGIADAIKKIIEDNGLNKSNILGIGIGLPGLIDAERGLVHFLPNIPGWKGVPLKNILEKKLGLAVFLDNDANLMTLAEYKIGAAKGLKNVLCLTLGTGVGGGVVIGGSLYRGRSFAAGEIGHIPVNEEGLRCNCGGIACLETYIGNKRIEKQAKDIFGRDITLEELSRMARQGDKRARGLWLSAAGHLGIALSGIVNLLNPDAIVIGGGVAGAGRVLFDRVREVVRKRAMPVQARRVKIFKAALGNDAGLIGAAILVKEGVD